MRGYVVQSGVGKPGACHLFRHTMATLMLEGGAEIRFAIHRLKAIHDATHPGARFTPCTAGVSSLAAPSSDRAAEEILAALAAEADEEEQE